MIETFLATLGVAYAPTLVDGMEMPGGIIGSLLLPRLYILGFIVAITIVTNVVRALRWCRNKQGKYKSTGVLYGLYKGLIAGGFSVIAYTIVTFIPVLRIPFTVISFIPYIGTMVDGFIMSIFYLIGYLMFAYPFFGSC